MIISKPADLWIRMQLASVVLYFCPAFSYLQIVFLVVLVATLVQFRSVTTQIVSSNPGRALRVTG